MMYDILPETHFAYRETPWKNLGVAVSEAPTSKDAIDLAGLGWLVGQQKVFTADGIEIPDTLANVRLSDNKVLGVVGKQYKIYQNYEAFSFTDNLLGEGVVYETAGSLKGGRQIWLLARLPESYKILGDIVEPFVVFTNTHDGSGAVKVAMTPIRVLCKNSLNAALKGAKRIWSARHTGSLEARMEQARETLELADTYMQSLNNFMEDAYKVKLDEKKVGELVEELIPLPDKSSERKKTNVTRIRTDILFRYAEAPDLKEREQTGARFIQAVADTASHIEPARLTANYNENFFAGMINGNNLLDRAMDLVRVRAA